MTGIFYLFVCYYAGILLAGATGGYIPGSVIGMVLFFLALRYRLFSPEKAKGASLFLLDNMPLFFIPIGVGLMNSYGLLGSHLFAIVLSACISTALIIVVVGHLQQRAERKSSQQKRSSTPFRKDDR